MIQTPCPCCFDTHIIPHDDDILLQPLDPIDTDDQEQPPHFLFQQQQEQLSASNNLRLMPHPPTMQIHFSLLQQIIKPKFIDDKEDPSTLTLSDELLCWHYKLGHALFKTLTMHGNPRRIAQETSNKDSTILCCLQIQKANQMSLAYQRTTNPLAYDNATRTSHISRST